MEKNEILKRIEYFSEEKKISSYKIGLELGHSKTYFYRIKSGEIQLTAEMLLEVLDILGITTSEFFCPYINEEDTKILDSIMKLSKENKQTIIDLIEKLGK